MPPPERAWLMSLKQSPDSNWGSPEGLLQDVEATLGDESVSDFQSKVWGRNNRPGMGPQPGDGLGFYHSTRALFPSPDPYRRRPRITLIAEIATVSQTGQEVTDLAVRVRRTDLDRMRENPLVRNDDTARLFNQCITSGAPATFYEVPPSVWHEFLSLAGSAPVARTHDADHDGHDSGAPNEEDSQPSADAIEYHNRAERLLATGSIRRPQGVMNPVAVPGSVLGFQRDPLVRAWVLQRSEGHCELCGAAAPFRTARDQPYLECHHAVLLANGGPDTPNNTAAICPNCHRNFHYGKDRENLTRQLIEKIRVAEELAIRTR